MNSFIYINISINHILTSILFDIKTQLIKASFYTYNKATYTTPKPAPSTKASASSEGRRKLQINYTSISAKLIRADINSSHTHIILKGGSMVHLGFIL